MTGSAVDPFADPRFEQFVHLFNEGRWFEAHEVLESLWLEAPESMRDPLQALIQVAVGLEHARRGNRQGALRVLERAGKRWNLRENPIGPAGSGHATETLAAFGFPDLLTAADNFVTGSAGASPQIILPPGFPRNPHLSR